MNIKIFTYEVIIIKYIIETNCRNIYFGIKKGQNKNGMDPKKANFFQKQNFKDQRNYTDKELSIILHTIFCNNDQKLMT